MRKIKSVLKRRAKLFVLLAFIFLVVVVGLWLLVGNGDDPEKRALEFYKAAWVEGNAEKAKTFGPPGADAAALQGYVKKGKNTPIMIAEYPIASSSYRLYYIYRPSDNSMFAVQLTKYDGKWVVNHYDQHENYSMQMIDRVFPQLQDEWREIENP